MTRSAEEIEREVEATRGELDRTVEALKDRMSAGQIIDELMGSMKGTGASQMVSNLGAQARDNPIPLALIGAGLAWLAFGRPPERRSHQERRSFEVEPYTGQAYEVDTARYHEDYDPLTGAELSSESDGHGLKEKAGEAAAKVKSAAKGVAAKASHAMDDAKEGLGSARERAGERIQSVRGRAGGGYDAAGRRLHDTTAGVREHAREYSRKAQRTFLETMEDEPLLIAALGVAVGAAVGAALPATRVENRYLGRWHDRAMDEGKHLAEKGVEDARQIARATLGAVREEADRQGIPTEPESLADRVGQVAKAGLDTAKREMDQRRPH